MKRMLILASIFFTIISIHAESKILIHPDSFYIPLNAYPLNSDSLVIKNLGTSFLKIDSIKNKHIYTYPAEAIDDSGSHGFSVFCSEFYSLGYQSFKINPSDSILLIVFSPDLCPMCKKSDLTHNFTDSFFVYSNDTTNSPVILKTYGWGSESGMLDDTPPQIENVELFPNYPNPFNNSTVIRYHLPKSSDIRLSIYDINGGLVLNLVDGIQPSGTKEISWEGKNRFGDQVASGIYCLMLSADKNRFTRKILHIK
jgi:hypothetical protein